MASGKRSKEKRRMQEQEEQANTPVIPYPRLPWGPIPASVSVISVTVKTQENEEAPIVDQEWTQLTLTLDSGRIYGFAIPPAMAEFIKTRINADATPTSNLIIPQIIPPSDLNGRN